MVGVTHYLGYHLLHLVHVGDLVHLQMCVQRHTGTVALGRRQALIQIICIALDGIRRELAGHVATSF